MDALVRKTIATPYGPKQISVHAQDITAVDWNLDVMTISAFWHDYQPVPGTLIHALRGHGIDVGKLSARPAYDLRESSGVWISRPIRGADLPIQRIGCVELMPYSNSRDREKADLLVLSRIQAYFHLLHIASLSGAKMKTVGIPVLGGGSQGVDASLTAIPTLNECVRFLRTDEQVREIHIISRNQAQAYQFASALDRSYTVQRSTAPTRGAVPTKAGEGSSPLVFISYSFLDQNVADNLCAKLEKRGVRVWYAPRNIRNSDYASAIADAIGLCTHFVVVISEHSLASFHVLNEVDLAFQELGRHVRIMPLRIDEMDMGSAFRYYLSRQHWMDAHLPPLEDRLGEFADRLLEDISE